MILCIYTVSRIGGCVDRDLNEQVMIERVEMIARLTAEGTCHERDREIALNLIAEMTRGNLFENHNVAAFMSSLDMADIK